MDAIQSWDGGNTACVLFIFLYSCCWQSFEKPFALIFFPILFFFFYKCKLMYSYLTRVLYMMFIQIFLTSFHLFRLRVMVGRVAPCVRVACILTRELN